jgi:hypothetical protein
MRNVLAWNRADLAPGALIRLVKQNGRTLSQ